MISAAPFLSALSVPEAAPPLTPEEVDEGDAGFLKPVVFLVPSNPIFFSAALSSIWIRSSRISSASLLSSLFRSKAWRFRSFSMFRSSTLPPSSFFVRPMIFFNTSRFRFLDSSSFPLSSLDRMTPRPYAVPTAAAAPTTMSLVDDLPSLLLGLWATDVVGGAATVPLAAAAAAAAAAASTDWGLIIPRPRARAAADETTAWRRRRRRPGLPRRPDTAARMRRRLPLFGTSVASPFSSHI
mmetsp:Transcript_21092/g.60482  ORF Transcript_21092/g.60482 Transcript_21092/m.60482 type:complete len:240 (+) Transcript_21092:767-1486(+)